jgi:choline dehydrogenase-like flavoprotein
MIGAGTVIVIGSGPSGAMAAHELVRQGSDVILLESGSTLPQGMLVRLMGRNLFRRKQRMEDGNIHASSDGAAPEWWYDLSPGGLSNHWTGAVPRFAPEDFHEGERLHELYRWPLSYQDLLPYYAQAERLLSLSSDPRDVQNLPAGRPVYRRSLSRDWEVIAAQATCRGQGMTVLPLADGTPCMVVGRGTAFNSYVNLIAPLIGSPHFKLIIGAHALCIAYSGSKRRVEAVVYVDKATNTQHRLEADAVMVACGALHSTKLLFDSACPEFPDGLGNVSGLLGRYLHDHPRDWWTFELERPLSRPSPPVYLTRLPYHSSPPLQATSWTIGLIPSAGEKLLSLTPMKTHRFATQVFGTMVPTERQHVRPDSVLKDPFGRPKLSICLQYDDTVAKNMSTARDHLLTLMEDAGYRGALKLTPTRITPGSSVHYGGTIRMHQSPQYGMLDSWNRLHEISNLLVVDASCFTTGPEKNPTLTAMALAARAADRLVQDLSRGGRIED